MVRSSVALRVRPEVEEVGLDQVADLADLDQVTRASATGEGAGGVIAAVDGADMRAEGARPAVDMVPALERRQLAVVGDRGGEEEAEAGQGDQERDDAAAAGGGEEEQEAEDGHEVGEGASPP
jgi:hypothetical protein